MLCFENIACVCVIVSHGYFEIIACVCVIVSHGYSRWRSLRNLRQESQQQVVLLQWLQLQGAAYTYFMCTAKVVHSIQIGTGLLFLGHLAGSQGHGNVLGM